MTRLYRFSILLLLTLYHGKSQNLEVQNLKARNVKVENVTHKGRTAVRLIDQSGNDGQSLAIVGGTNLGNGSIEVDLAGDISPGASETARGFVGVAFHLTGDGSRYECFYLRPLNGRADDQERRNHSAQYIAAPDFPWQRLRKETPSKYESYVDLLAGEWTHVGIEVDGLKARLFVNQATQPTLIVNDLKNGMLSGAVALWIGPETTAHFANLRVVAK